MRGERHPVAAATIAGNWHRGASTMPIVLDTNIVRDIGAGDLDPRPFEAAASAGIKVHLSDTAGSELMHALVAGNMDWGHWRHASMRLKNFVDRSEPILLGGGLGLMRAGLVPTGRFLVPSEIDEAIATYKAGWKLLTKAKCRGDLSRIRVHSPASRATWSVNTADVGGVMAAEKTRWVKEFASFERALLPEHSDLQARLPARNDSPEALEEYVKIIKGVIDSGVHPRQAPLASDRLDAFLRVDALLHLRRLRRANRYNPEKNSNDALDHMLLTYLANPAAICTRDKGIKAGAVAAGSWQEKWIVRPEDLQNPIVLASLVDMRWPAPVDDSD